MSKFITLNDLSEFDELKETLQKELEKNGFPVRKSKKPDLKEALGISTKAANALYRRGICTVEDLKNTTQVTILKGHCIGPVLLNEVVTAAKKIGIDIPKGEDFDRYYNSRFYYAYACDICGETHHTRDNVFEVKTLDAKRIPAHYSICPNCSKKFEPMFVDLLSSLKEDAHGDS